MFVEEMTGETIGATISIGMGACLVAWSIFRFVRDRRALQWPSVIGRITRSDVNGEWDSTSSSDGGNELTYMYSPEIEYSYSVRGLEYSGNRFRQFKVSSTSRRWAEKVAARFPVGSEIEVLYDPSKPSSSMLRQAALKPIWLALFLLLGVALVIGGSFWISREHDRLMNNTAMFNPRPAAELTHEDYSTSPILKNFPGSLPIGIVFSWR